MKRVPSLQSGSTAKILHLVLNKLVRISYYFSEEKFRLQRKTWACILPNLSSHEMNVKAIFLYIYIYICYLQFYL